MRECWGENNEKVDMVPAVMLYAWLYSLIGLNKYL